MPTNTHKGRRAWVSSVAISADVDLNQAGFEALSWVEILGIGMVGDIGASSNIISYDPLNTDVSQKQKGVTNAGDPTIEVAISHTDAGQIIMRTAADNKFNYGIKIQNADAPSANFNGSIRYSRMIVGSAVETGGRVDDFQTETYQLGLNQRVIKVAPAATVVPAVILKPAVIAGAAGTTAAGQVLTAYEGTYTNGEGGLTYAYQWQEDTANNGTYINISGATAKTYTIGSTGSQVGDSMRVQVTPSNAAGAGTQQSSLGTDLGV